MQLDKQVMSSPGQWSLKINELTQQFLSQFTSRDSSTDLDVFVQFFGLNAGFLRGNMTLSVHRCGVQLAYQYQ